MISFFKKKKTAAIEKVRLISISELYVGLIIKMAPGYHTKKPYYVEVVYLNKNARQGERLMTTNIPGQHKCDMKIGENWNYHHSRMTIMGPKCVYGYLLNNQLLN